MTWLSRDTKNQSDQPEQTMGTGSCFLKTMQLKEASGWFVEDFLANMFWDKTVPEVFEVAEAGADFSHRTPASFSVRGILCKILELNWCSYLILTLIYAEKKKKAQLFLVA